MDRRPLAGMRQIEPTPALAIGGAAMLAWAAAVHALLLVRAGLHSATRAYLCQSPAKSRFCPDSRVEQFVDQA